MKVRKIVGSALALGVGLAMSVGGAAFAEPDPSAASIDKDQPVSLTIHKYSGEPVKGDDGKPLPDDGNTVEGIPNTPLAGVEFTLCKVTGIEIHDPGDWVTINRLDDAIRVSDTHSFPNTGVGTDFSGVGLSTECISTSTDAGGEAKFFEGGTDGANQGVYYVTETKAPANVAEKTLPFLVTLPLPDNAANGWIYDVNVHPKNALVDIEKEAVDGGSIGVGSEVEWKVYNKIPTIQHEFTDYRLRDVLDGRLDYVEGSSTIMAGTTELTSPSDFVVSDTAGTVLVTFTEAGLTKLDNNQGENLVWSFQTSVKSIGDGIIKNDASVLVNNPDGNWNEAPTSEKVSSNWGAVEVFKHENKDDSPGALEGAVFQVFGSEEHANACKAAVLAADGTLTAGCDNTVSVTRDKNGAVVDPAQDQFTTGANGKVVIPGLHVGVTNVPAKVTDSTERNYWLVEIVPPVGYINANEVYEVNVTAGTVASAVKLEVENKQEFPGTLPMTGAQVKMIMTVGAVLLGAGAILLVVLNRRKAERA